MCFFFIFIFTGGVAVFLTACGAQSEGGNGGGISDPENPEDGEITENPDDDVEAQWTTELNFYIYCTDRTSSTSASSSTASTTNSAGMFDFYWFNAENSASQNLSENDDMQYTAAPGYSASYSGNYVRHINYFHYWYYSISKRYRYAEIRSARRGSYVFCGMTRSPNDNSQCRTVHQELLYFGSQTWSTSKSDVLGNSWWISDVTQFYLVFRKQYIMTFNKNGGSGGPSSVATLAGVGFTISSSKPTRTGYTFGGWKCSSNSTTYSAGAYISDSLVNEAMTFTAQWTPIIYTISLNANGGSISTPSNTSVGSVSGASYGFSYNGTYYVSQNKGVANSAAVARVNFTTTTPYQAVSFDVVQFAEKGYDFALFSYLDSTLSTSNTVDSSYYWNGGNKQTLITQNVLYVVPTPGAHYIYVKYRKDSSSNVNNDNLQFRFSNMTTIYLKYGVGWFSDLTCYTPIGTIGATSRTGYTFLEWNTNSAGTGTSVTNGAGTILLSNTAFSSNTTLYAKWTINQYYINISILDPGGGEPCDGTAGTMTVYYSDTGQTYNGCGDQPKAHVSYNSTIRISNISPGVGMHLSSVSSSSGRGSWNGSTFTFTVAAADDSIIIYMAYNTYTITYNPNGGSGSSQTQTVTYKSSFTTKPSNTFSKTSYTFTGWGGSYPSANASYTYNTVGNTTLYAQWSANTATQKLYQMYATGTGASPSYTMGGSGGNMYMSFHYDNNGTATAVREKQFGAGPNSQVFLTGYSRTITAEAYTPGQYIFMGLTTTNTPPTGLNPPTTNSITVSGTDTTTVYAWYRQVPNSAAIIKWGAEIGYYFESGEFPQSYLGTSVSGLGSVSYNIPYLNANGSTVNIPVYSYSGGKCALVSGKYFKVEPIKWKVNDAVWGMYGAYNTNITAVTAEVIGFGAVAPSSAGKEGWAWTSSGMYSNTNTTAGRMSLTNANNTSVSYDKFNAAGTQTIVASNSNSVTSQLRVAGLSEIKSATGRASAGAGWAAKCSDFVAFMTTGSTTGGVYADYWTRNLAGDTFKGYHQNGLSITASGYESSKYLSYAQGVRYAMTLSSGRNMGGTAARYLRVYSNGSDKNEGNHISYLSVETADAGDILLIDAPAGVGANSLISWGNIYPAGALSYFDVGTETILDIGKEVQILSVTLRRYYSDGRHYYRSKVEGSLTNGDDWFVIHNSHNEGSYGNDITANTYAETSSGRKFAVNQGLFNADDWMSYINYCDATKESNQNFKQYMWKDLDDSFWWGGETVYNQNTAVYYDYHVTLKPGLYRMSYHGMSTRSDGNTTTCVRPVGEASFNGEWYVYKGKTEYSYTFTVGSGFVGFQGGYWYGDWTNFKNIRLEFVAETSNKNFALNTNFSTFNTGFTPGWDTSLNRLPYDTHNWGMANMGVPNSATGYHAHLAYDTDKGGYVVELVNKSPSLGRWIGTSQWFDAGILQPGRTYTIQLDARKVGSGSPHLTGGLYYDINGAYAFHNNYYDFVLTEEWQTYTYTFTTSTSMDASKSAYLYVYGMEGGEGTSWIDNVYIYES